MTVAEPIQNPMKLRRIKTIAENAEDIIGSTETSQDEERKVTQPRTLSRRAPVIDHMRKRKTERVNSASPPDHGASGRLPKKMKDLQLNLPHSNGQCRQAKTRIHALGVCNLLNL